MQQNELQNLWEESLALVQARLAQPSYELWLRNTQPLSYDPITRTLVVQFPNETARRWVANRYAPLLRKTLTSLMGHPCQLRLITGRAGSAPDDSGPGSSEAPDRPVSSGGEPVPGLTSTPGTPDGNEGHGAWSAGAPQEAPALNQRYTFDTFVVGESNRFAHAAARAVAELPAHNYNPLFIYGGVGLGKTHLMHAIGHETLRLHPGMRVVYVTSETFTNDLINAIRDEDTEAFRNRYRTIDLLLVDDIQFVANKERTQEEFFHTFNALYEANKQIVISSDRPPKEIPTLEDRLRSRFEWGLLTDIQAPDLETRIAILRKKVSMEHLAVPDAVLNFIANQIHSNIRELEGALIRVAAYASLTYRPITVELASEALKDLAPSSQRNPITIERIQAAVAEQFSLRAADMKAKNRSRAVAFPRQIAMYLARELTDASLPRIGEAFGGRDHTTVIHAYERIQESLRQDPALAELIQKVIRRLQN